MEHEKQETVGANEQQAQQATYEAPAVANEAAQVPNVEQERAKEAPVNESPTEAAADTAKNEPKAGTGKAKAEDAILNAPTLPASWMDEETLRDTTVARRNNERVLGIVRGALKRNVIRRVNGQAVTETKEILIVSLENGAQAYCLAENYATREYKNYSQFVGHKAYFYIADIQLDTKYIFLDRKRVQTEESKDFWARIRKLESEGKLESKVFKAIVRGTSLNGRNRNVFISIEGQDAIIPAKEWSYNMQDMMVVYEGEEIEVRITRVDHQQKRITASRRLTLPNPTDIFADYGEEDVIAGKVVEVNPITGIKVELENNIVVKASRRKSLDEPIVGDLVSCRIVTPITFDEQDGKIKGRVLIRSYPHGKKKRRNLGAFLFE